MSFHTEAPPTRTYDAPTLLNQYGHPARSYGSAPPPAPRPAMHQHHSTFATAASDLASSSPLRPSHPHASYANGTQEDPLIPKRRRRTTPAELAILEAEYRVKPRPDPIERAHLAERLGMTVRAVQVWYQNRRQKEKRGSSCSSSITSTGSDPKDLDGVVLSFSSSPLPSPVLPLHPTAGSFGRSAVSGGPKDSVASASAAAGAPAFSGASVAPSGRLVLQSATAAADKENVKSPTGDAAGVRASHLLTPVSSATVPYRYSYPSQHSGHASSTGDHPSSSGSYHPEGQHAHVFVHRPHNSSIIAAKKHVRKRPLGSHAPLARTPSLPHSFAFPPSPPRSSSSQQVAASSSSARRTLQRSASHSLNAVAGREQKKSAAGLFANSQGETVAHAADRRRSLSVSPTASAPSILHNNDYSGALTSSKRTAGSPEPASAASVPMSMMTPVSKARARDELLQHMQSDPPSTSSPGPIPLTRRRIEQLERSLADHEDEDSDEELKSAVLAPPKYAAGTARPQVSRSLSSPNTQATLALHGAQLTDARSTFRTPSHTRASSVPARSANAPPPAAPPSSSSPAPTAFGPSATHAGADLGICALKALGRKRARILEDQSTAAAAAAAAAVVVVGNVSAQGRTYTHALGLTSGGRRLGLTIDVARAASGGSQQQQKRRRVSGESVGTDDSSLADLSYSSTSTASTADSLTTVADESTSNGDYFALAKRSSMGRACAEPPKSPEDEQRECAELLLGLGGAFY
ncbi:hypothetical protein C6P46_004354 [Rhodotorula mucilaginosa]|uniref:Homeobox domain-containing protein n=1 Tax=Rhodotorula mucilaginosa TaxID=5537 RepID=A0A9P6W9B1_RHOMI|nr:hypothetical protein C6P46_004354 [Rhodotorula mucilaginosa]TKA55007.1 hypothetical protein B0A53_02480 [Rhodotorula sp. CCFEE 5036]